MKIKILLFIYFTISAFFFLPTTEEHQYIPLTVLDKTVEKETTHRGYVDIPIEAYYADDCVVVSFLQNIGEVVVVISNRTTGVNIGYEVESRIGLACLRFSKTPGLYQIEIYVSSGDAYGGFFEVM